jgi:hypothetical protein
LAQALDPPTLFSCIAGITGINSEYKYDSYT